MNNGKEQKTEVSTEIAIINENTIRDKIYIVRGVQVMLDFELAEIYGYETKNFNRQVKNNAEKFDGNDFMFQLTRSEIDDLVRCKNFTSRESNFFKGQSGGARYLPYAFTEQGVYMLMTVLKGSLAVKQSRALIRTFKAMKEYIIQNQGLVVQNHYLLQLSEQISKAQSDILDIQTDQKNYEAIIIDHSKQLGKVIEQLGNTVKKSELSPIMLDFSNSSEQSEFVFLESQALTAAEAYRKIYTQAKKTIHIIDDYIDSKTLHLLQVVQQGIDITIFSDNNYGKLKASDYADFQAETPNVPITFIHTQKMSHDRFIILDHNTVDEQIFLCGASSKDAGKRMTGILKFTDGAVKNTLSSVVTQMLSNPALILK
ncbi:MAG: ORF6N domain-containing protein [Ruminococcus sp.]|nr:ORF6N domain-containing protein [Ruminococcus sp.]